MEYILLTHDTPRELEASVNKHIAQGWTPQGGVCGLTKGGSVLAGTHYAQAMVKLPQRGIETKDFHHG